MNLPPDKYRLKAYLFLALSFGPLACSQSIPKTYRLDGDLVAVRETVDNVTTVRSISGSIWGRKASLREVLSIGDSDSSSAYFFGRIGGVVELNGRTYVLDTSLPGVRVFDEAGVHLFDFGREGQGPGEFVSPNGIAVNRPLGRIYIRDQNLQRVNVYSEEGILITTLRLTASPGPGEMAVAEDGRFFSNVPLEVAGASPNSVFGMVSFNEGGANGDTIRAPYSEHVKERLYARHRNGSVLASWPMPFSPEVIWLLTPRMELVSGLSSVYGIEIRRPNGNATIISKEGDPIEVPFDEALWYQRAIEMFLRSFDPSWSWSGVNIPRWKPYYSDLLVDPQGMLWVLRISGRIRLEECADPPTSPDDLFRSPCWADSISIDVFDIPSGEFLGEVEAPKQRILGQDLKIISVTEGSVLCVVRSDDGASIVKRYSLEIPSEPGGAAKGNSIESRPANIRPDQEGQSGHNVLLDNEGGGVTWDSLATPVRGMRNPPVRGS